MAIYIPIVKKILMRYIPSDVGTEFEWIYMQ
jgi:hypothetical protein